jgi:hypothetical protein
MNKQFRWVSMKLLTRFDVRQVGSLHSPREGVSTLTSQNPTKSDCLLANTAQSTKGTGVIAGGDCVSPAVSDIGRLSTKGQTLANRPRAAG